MNKILVIQTAFIGDVILATGVVETLRSAFPDAQIDFLLRKGNESLLANNTSLNKVIVWNKKEGKWKSMLRIVKQLRKEKYDAVFNLQRFFSSGLMTCFSGAKVKSGFDKNPMSFCYSHKAAHIIGTNLSDSSNLHEVDRNHAVIAPFISTPRSNPKLYPSSEDFKFIEAYLGSDFITISPASVWETKKTPLCKWVELVKKFTPQKVYLLGGPSDISICEELKIQIGTSSVEVLAGQLSLLQSAALMSKAKMNFVNDSGPLHLCSAMNAPVTAVFCSTIPAFGFTPLSDNAKVIEVSETLNCRPCGLHGHKVCPQGHFKCGNDLNVDLML